MLSLQDVLLLCHGSHVMNTCMRLWWCSPFKSRRTLQPLLRWSLTVTTGTHGQHACNACMRPPGSDQFCPRLPVCPPLHHLSSCPLLLGLLQLLLL